MTSRETEGILHKLQQMKNLLDECIAAISSKDIKVAVKPPSTKSELGKQAASDKISEIDLVKIVNKIRDCDEADRIEKYILDKIDREGRVLLPFYICYKYFNGKRLNSRDIEKITSELNTKVSINNVSSLIGTRLSKYLEGDTRRKRGKATNYKLNRKGITYFESLINTKQ